MVDEFLLAPHVSLDVALVELIGVFGNAVVGEVCEAVGEVVVAVVFCTEAEVALFVEPNFGLS